MNFMQVISFSFIKNEQNGAPPKKEDLNESGIRIREILRSYPSVQN